MEVAAQGDSALPCRVLVQRPQRVLIPHVDGEVGIAIGQGCEGVSPWAPKPLPAAAQDVLVGVPDDVVLFLGLGVRSDVDVVEAADAQQREAVGLAQVVVQFALDIAVHGHRPGADGIDDEIEITAPRRDQPGAASPVQGSFENKSGTGHAEVELAVELVAVALAQFDVQHG